MGRRTSERDQSRLTPKEVNELVASEFRRLSEKYKIPVPKYETIAGTGSFFDHEDQGIRLSKVVLDSGRESAVKYLVSHEFRHWHQFYKGHLQTFRSLREIEAHRVAMDEVTGRERVFPLLERPTPFLDSLATEFDQERSPFEDMCDAGTCLSCKQKYRRFGK